MTNISFNPHPLFSNGHLQTIAGFYLPSVIWEDATDRHEILLDDGDTIVVHANFPEDCRPDKPAVLLVHGLGGCHGSTYTQRVGKKLYEAGYRVIRMDLRGCGAGEGLARNSVHCGRWKDIAAVVEWLAKEYPAAQIYLVGFSLGGAIALNLVGELGPQCIGNLANVLAICPPIDLSANASFLERPIARPYNHFFVKMLLSKIQRRRKLIPDAPRENPTGRPKSLREFDSMYTAPLGGFHSVEDYYRQASPGPRLQNIHIPTTILASADDPIIRSDNLGQYPQSDAIVVEMTQSGGHMGFIGRRSELPDRRWLDWRIMEWVQGQANCATDKVTQPSLRHAH